MARPRRSRRDYLDMTVEELLDEATDLSGQLHDLTMDLSSLLKVQSSMKGDNGGY